MSPPRRGRRQRCQRDGCAAALGTFAVLAAGFLHGVLAQVHQRVVVVPHVVALDGDAGAEGLARNASRFEQREDLILEPFLRSHTRSKLLWRKELFSTQEDTQFCWCLRCDEDHAQLFGERGRHVGCGGRVTKETGRKKVIQELNIVSLPRESVGLNI